MEPNGITKAPTSVGRPVADTQECAAPPAAGDVSLMDLEARVQRLLGSRIRHFQIVTGGDGLILKGNAKSWYVKQLAQHTVMEAVCIRILANEIVV